MSAIALAGGAMYVAQKESKSTEGQKSIYHSAHTSPSRPDLVLTQHSKPAPGGIEQNDAKMNSGDVRAAMHKAPGKS